MPKGNVVDPIEVMNDAKYTSFHRNLAIVASLGAFVDLYVIQALGASTFSIVPFFLHTTSSFAFTASLLFIGAVIGVFSMGTVVDRIGRRITFIMTLSLVVIFSVLSAFVTTPLELNILRFLLGFATGADYPAAMTIVSEFLPSKERGRGITYLWAGFTLGGVAAYLVGYIFYITIGPTPYEWRILLGSVAVPAFIGVILRTTLPESPRWAISKEKYTTASKSIERASGRKLSESDLKISRSLLFEKERPQIQKHYWKYFMLILPLTIAVMLFNLVPGALSTLNPTILSSLGIAKAGTLLYSAAFLAVQFVAVMIVAYTIDKVGRIKWAVIGGALEGILALFVILFSHNAIALFALFMGLSFFAFIAVPVMRNTGTELFPTEFRGFSSGVVMTGDRVASVIGLLITPLLFVGKDVTLLFSVYGIIGLVGAAIAFLGLRGRKIDKMSLEEIQMDILEETDE